MLKLNICSKGKTVGEVDPVAKMGGGGHRKPRPLYPRERDPLPIVQEAGPRGRSGWVRKILPAPEIEPRTIQPVASCYSDYAIPAA